MWLFCYGLLSFAILGYTTDQSRAMPPKKQGEGALARYNAKKPTVAFRVHDAGMKDAIYAQAKRKRLSVSAYICGLIAADLETKPKPKPKPRSKPKPKRDAGKAETSPMDEMDLRVDALLKEMQERSK